MCYVVYWLVDNVLRRDWARLHSMVHDIKSTTEDLPEDLKYEDIMQATEGLSDKYVIGKGRHGTFYRTESINSSKSWAKKLDLSELSFSQEMRTLSMVRHRNLVRMAGYCIKHGTLFGILHSSESRTTLEWDARHRIAQGLSYLHHDCVPQIVHRDVKSENVLMDSDMEPRVNDFGMAKLVSDPDESFSQSSIVGTLGYIASENGHSTRLTEKCDVYSYGVILLELLCRRMPVDPSFEDGLDIVAWVKGNLQTREKCCPFCFLDEKEISFWTEDEKLKAVELLDLALCCTQFVPDTRPSMGDAVRSLMKMNAQQKKYIC